MDAFLNAGLTALAGLVVLALWRLGVVLARLPVVLDKLEAATSSLDRRVAYLERINGVAP